VGYGDRFFLWKGCIKCFSEYYLYNFNCYINTIHYSTSYLYYKKPSCGPVGKIMCIIIIALCIINWILTLIFFIITGKDYSNTLKEIGSNDWAELIIPCIFSLIGYITAALCANYLYKACSDLCEISYPVNQIIESNLAQPGTSPNNATGLVVNIHQSEANK